MPAFAIDLDATLLIGRAVFLVFCFVLAAITFTRWRRAAERSTALFVEQTALVREQLAAIETRIETTNGAVAELSERIAVLNTSGAGNANSASYQIAIRMARSGTAREELMASCGLTRQEAELVQRLHAPAQRSRIAAVG